MDFSSFLQVQAAPCAEEQPPHGAFYGIQRVPFWSHLTQLCSSISQACAANWSFNMLFLQQQSLVWWQTSHGSWVLYLLLNQLSASFRSFWSSPPVILGFCGETFHFWITAQTLLSGTFRNPSVIRMFSNKRQLFTHHELFPVWRLGNETPFYRPSVGREPAGLHSFQAFLHLPSFMCSILFLCLFTVLHIIYNLWFDFFACVDCISCYQHLVNISQINVQYN